MSQQLEKIKEAIEPLRQQIINHKIYAVINDVEDLKIFMEHHVYAVWDFMSLLKTLQNNLTCTAVPWVPKGSANTRYLINEIVVGEECDIDAAGNRKSHFEIYLEAMEQCGADTSKIQKFIKTLIESGDFTKAFAEGETPELVQNFVRYTFDIINIKKDYLQAAIFTFGREDLIPGMFISMINDIDKKFPESISIFKYYLERHIEVDGGHHSDLALQMTESLCGNNSIFWNEAEEATVQSLEKRIELWDAAYESIVKSKTNIDVLAECAL